MTYDEEEEPCYEVRIEIPDGDGWTEDEELTKEFTEKNSAVDYYWFCVNYAEDKQGSSWSPTAVVLTYYDANGDGDVLEETHFLKN